MPKSLAPPAGWRRVVDGVCTFQPVRPMTAGTVDLAPLLAHRASSAAAADAVSVADLRDWCADDVRSSEWGLEVDDVLALLETLVPDDLLAATLRRLEPPLLTEGQKARALRLWERHARWTTAQLHAAVVAVAGPTRGRGRTADLDQTGAEIEVGFALGVTDTYAAQQIATARTLHRVFTRTRESLARGEISAANVRSLVAETVALDADAARAVEDVALRPAHVGKVLGKFTSVVRKAVLRVDPATAAERVSLAATKRGVSFRPLPDGQALLRLVGPAADVHTCFLAVDGLARRHRSQHPGDGRTLAQLQADVLTDVLSGVLADPSMPKAHKLPVTVGITADMATLLGLADNPAMLEGYGPIDAVTARRLAADADWKLLVLDGVHGSLVGLSTRSYTPTARIAEFLRHRDGTCTVPRCSALALRCDIDHIVPFDHADPARGGPTDVSNLHDLCEHHHQARHDGCLGIRQVDERMVEWITRSGMTFRSEPPDLRPSPPPTPPPPTLDDEPPF